MLALGCNRYVTKPFNMGTLVQDVLEVLEDTGGLSPRLHEYVERSAQRSAQQQQQQFQGLGGNTPGISRIASSDKMPSGATAPNAAGWAPTPGAAPQMPGRAGSSIMVVSGEEHVLSAVQAGAGGYQVDMLGNCMAAMSLLITGKRDPLLAVVDLTGSERSARIELVRTLR